MLREETVRKELEKTFTSREREQDHSLTLFASRLRKLNKDIDFDENIMQQLYSKLQRVTRSEYPDLSEFPRIYLEAFDALDRKIDLEEDNIAILNEKISENENVLNNLNIQFQNGNLPNQKQVK